MAAGAGRGLAATPRRLCWVLLAALAVGACATSARGTAETDGGPRIAPQSARAGASGRGSPNVLTGDELRETRAANLWDALRQLRPQWLRARASSSLISGPGDEPVVYVHDIQHGPIRTLQQMNIDRVRRVEFIDGRDATTRFGTGHGGGVLMVDLDR